MIVRGYGTTDDYNPMQTSGKLPGCSLVFDATGNELVYAVKLNPGDTLRMRYEAMPNTASGALYIIDDCTELSWPDYDGAQELEEEMMAKQPTHLLPALMSMFSPRSRNK